ncbi:hypothetical protein [uncultured Lacinutrix sp.]|uniref:hypothetical protein n=1 Tax=uncultured Lacinutrix sp. TaxID=574032 RepID=UPI002628E562|nr:hypothetical protein [uncultured Lacinutrix sp.]
MNLETAKYIIDYFPNLLTSEEWNALRYLRLKSKTQGNPRMERLLRKKGDLIISDVGAELIKNGSKSFRINVGKRILKESPDDIFMNECLKCGFLARTPQSRQCRNCGHNWHKIKVADFKLNTSFQLTGGYFYVLGEIRNGNVEIGNFIDLTMLGMNCKPKIEKIEFALKKINGIATEDIALGTNELTKSQKERLKEIDCFGTPFDIIKER